MIRKLSYSLSAFLAVVLDLLVQPRLLIPTTSKQ